MDERYQPARDGATLIIQRLQGFPWDGVSGDARETQPLRRLVDVYHRFPEGEEVGELTDEECEDLVKATMPVLDRLDQIKAEKHNRGMRGIAPVEAGIKLSGIREQCEAALPIVSNVVECVMTRARIKRMESIIGENKEKLAVVLEAQVQSSAAQQSNFFGEEAKKYENAAIHWGRMVFVSIVAFIIFAAVAWWATNLADVNNGRALALVLANRALFFVVLGFGVFFCAKNYMANCHNAVVNRHRQKALETYLAVVNAVKDQKHRDIVLSYAAQCIYVPQDSGFSRRNSENEISADTILRLARGKMEE